MLYFDLTLVIQVVLFLLFLAILNAVFYQPVAAVFRQRSERIEAGQRASEESERRAQETQREVQRQLGATRAEAQARIAAVNREVGAQRQTLLAQAKGNADVIIGQAQEEIRYERQSAVEGLRRESVELAVLVAGKVVGRPLDTPENRRVADATIAEASGVG